MLHEFKIAYYLRDKKAKNKTSILLAISYGNSQRDIITTGLRINPSDWNNKKQTCSNKSIKDELLRIYQVILDYEVDIRYKNPRNFDLHELKFLIFENQPERLENEKPKDLFSDCIEQYYQLHKNVKAFNTIKKYPTLKRFFEDNFPNLRAKDINNEFAFRLRAFYLEKKLLNNTISKNFQLIRVVLRWLFDSNRLVEFSLDKFSHAGENKVEDVFLEVHELAKIIELDLSEKPNLERVRDQFLLSSSTAADWCDLHHLNKNNLRITKEGNKYFRFLRAKTIKKNIYSNPPCKIETELILEKYDWKIETISYDKSLQHLKTICELAEINQPITLKSYSGSQLIEETRPKHNWVGWKSGRRNFVTYCFLNNKSIDAILNATGQVKTSTLDKYNKASHEQKVDLLQK
jgi:hypothetical protein